MEDLIDWQVDRPSDDEKLEKPFHSQSSSRARTFCVLLRLCSKIPGEEPASHLLTEHATVKNFICIYIRSFPGYAALIQQAGALMKNVFWGVLDWIFSPQSIIADLDSSCLLLQGWSAKCLLLPKGSSPSSHPVKNSKAEIRLQQKWRFTDGKGHAYINNIQKRREEKPRCLLTQQSPPSPGSPTVT